MTHLLTGTTGTTVSLPPMPLPAAPTAHRLPPAVSSALGYSGAPPVTALLGAFIKKIGLTNDQFHRVVGYLHGDVVFYREPDTTKSAQAQLEWALLLALKNAVVKGSFIVDAEEVRQMCQQKGVFDRRNFYTNFRRQADHFRSPPEPAGKPQPLSSKGIAALGALVSELAERP
jgi:hypothetical protein